VAAAAAAADDDDDEDQASLSDLCKQACVRRDRLAGWLLYDRAIPTHYALAVHAVSPCIVRVACETRWYHSLLRLNARAHCIMSPPPPLSFSLSLSLSLYIYIYISLRVGGSRARLRANISDELDNPSLRNLSNLHNSNRGMYYLAIPARSSRPFRGL